MNKPAHVATGWTFGRLWPAAVTFLLPIVFSIAVLPLAVDYLLPTGSKWLPLTPDNIKADVFDRVANDLQGRFQYGVTSAFSQLIAVGGVVLAAMVLMRRFGRVNGLVFLVAAVLFGVAVCWLNRNQDLVRGKIFDDALALAQNVDAISKDTLAHVQQMIMVNMTVGLGATAALLAAFAAVAVGAAPEELEKNPATARHLRQRASDLQLLTICGALILVLVVIVNKGLLAWPQSLMTLGAAKSYGVLATAVGNYWGATGTGVLLCALVPSWLSLKSDIEAGAENDSPDNYAAQQTWRKNNGLDFAPTSALVATLTASAPLLAGPSIDLLSAFLK